MIFHDENISINTAVNTKKSTKVHSFQILWCLSNMPKCLIMINLKSMHMKNSWPVGATLFPKCLPNLLPTIHE